MAKCALLDPRFKAMVFTSQTNLTVARERLESEVAKLISIDQALKLAHNDIDMEESHSKVKQEENLIWEDFDKFVQTPKQVDSKVNAILEVKSYLNGNLIFRKENPLDWWKSRVS
ncbi:unnamed protein product [Diabrotica balteata]|uniref:Uncharacterized protein n=1 Tax=Diabrotica balteata TaxID=107213 RepID=A0A9N9XAC4_DIABA|nr:unnamed protein product [Diabrotica balteata]